MRLVEIAIGTTLRIPDGWDRFQYRGFIYERQDGGRWIVVAKVAA